MPLPEAKESLVASAALGQPLADLINPEMDVPGVSQGAIRPELKVIGTVTVVSGESFDPATDLDLTVGWGHPEKDGVTMPGKGKVIDRDYTKAEHHSIEEGASFLGLTFEQAVAQLGQNTCNVYLNDKVYWSNVPTNVWNFTIGGYQVLKKWFSYRQLKMLGRPITADEARTFTHMSRRLAAICLLEPQLDKN